MWVAGIRNKKRHENVFIYYMALSSIVGVKLSV